MQTVEIPRQSWTRQLDEFSAVHEGWLVTLEILTPDLGARPEIVDLPLVGVSLDRGGHNDTIVVTVARTPTEHHSHPIRSATRVFIESADDGPAAALEVESADGSKTILRFRSTPRPETVDGIVRF